MSVALSDLQRRLENVVCLGVISEVDHSTPRVRVTISGRQSGWLPYPAEVGANFRRWRPLRVGTQVLVACPSGDPANAVITQILYSAALPPPAFDGHVDLTQWDDGTMVRYDASIRTLIVYSAGDLTVQCEGTLRLRAGERVRLDAPEIRAFEEP
ncbi:phage baseplate assembly protein V [Pararhodospirillum photometricum]|uniref:phage baseplate assembly protein V n=1 Tax=Pararhodospirillum photometricum TaxID=1084 RepID=UPI000684C885|nr:phage baseplate assembly protein V [Pararhodospirillum photometricum]